MEYITSSTNFNDIPQVILFNRIFSSLPGMRCCWIYTTQRLAFVCKYWKCVLINYVATITLDTRTTDDMLKDYTNLTTLDLSSCGNARCNANDEGIRRMTKLKSLDLTLNSKI